ncbi:hypothetical protein DFA_09546 [Cavenderia fasciculata]|uniref:Uncharacterized protein n=1 Tax=Cavenderia fasciculata TaxID=261658 RepID=F4Q7X7_CACFS|nr:uncharacterized protein DFA_09546 [Cavenderia fasciculata]EGG15877.1 hypothetical protein DFA_09546 [Cavenderia fasciculata]|eukprot:XP_004352202.1 hypothetical protein DFA_09546 [Cavenderia fasciculata]
MPLQCEEVNGGFRGRSNLICDQVEIIPQARFDAFFQQLSETPDPILTAQDWGELISAIGCVPYVGSILATGFSNNQCTKFGTNFASENTSIP